MKWATNQEFKSANEFALTKSYGRPPNNSQPSPLVKTS